MNALARHDLALQEASAAAHAGEGPAWLRPYVAAVFDGIRVLVEAEGEAENAWRFGELLLACEELQTMLAAWLCERSLAGGDA